jgi:hypothetical protein
VLAIAPVRDVLANGLLVPVPAAAGAACCACYCLLTCATSACCTTCTCCAAHAPRGHCAAEPWRHAAAPLLPGATIAAGIYHCCRELPCTPGPLGVRCVEACGGVSAACVRQQVGAQLVQGTVPAAARSAVVLLSWKSCCCCYCTKSYAACSLALPAAKTAYTQSTFEWQLERTHIPAQPSPYPPSPTRQPPSIRYPSSTITQLPTPRDQH